MANPRLIMRSLVGIGALLLVFALASSWSGRAREDARRTSCQSGIKQIAAALFQYRLDFDGKFPPVEVHSASDQVLNRQLKQLSSDLSYGWADTIQPYFKCFTCYQCPSDAYNLGDFRFPEKPGYTDRWLNARLAGQKTRDARRILLGDGNGGVGTARYALHGLPTNWQNAPDEITPGGTQPPWFKRHLGGANYAFADGHVKWLKPEQIGGANARF